MSGGTRVPFVRKSKLGPITWGPTGRFESFSLPSSSVTSLMGEVEGELRLGHSVRLPEGYISWLSWGGSAGSAGRPLLS